MKYYLAIDIGASSGRHIVGHIEDGQIITDEVYRFPNGVRRENGRLTWDTAALLESVKAGIDAALEKYPQIYSLSIDTWGCDYVLLKGEEEVLPCYAYRDERTAEAIEEVHKIISFKELYKRTGIQFQPFTTIYQLYADKKSGRLDGATDFLMMPEYLTYKLTGVKKKEYTDGSTTGLVNAADGQFDGDIISALGLPAHLFPELCPPGTAAGSYKGIKVVACASHDTASAFEAIDSGEQPIISSGTWSLFGVKVKKPITGESSLASNYSNEGGVGYIRYLKNIMGMWVVNRLKSELCPEKSFPEIVELAKNSEYLYTCDVNAPAFLSPESMVKAFDGALKTKPESAGDYFRCAYLSLAESYKKALDELEGNTGKKYQKIYIVGGGAKNEFLNALTQTYTGKQVVALPIEATAIGNLKIQTEADR